MVHVWMTGASIIYSMVASFLIAVSLMVWACSAAHGAVSGKDATLLKVVIKRGGQEVCRKSCPETALQVDKRESDSAAALNSFVDDNLDSLRDDPNSTMSTPQSSSANDPNKVTTLLSKVAECLGLEHTPTNPLNEIIILWNLVDMIPQIDDCMAQQFPLGASLEQACWFLRPANPSASGLVLMRDAVTDMMFVDDYVQALEDALRTLGTEAESVVELRRLRLRCRGHRNPLLKAINELRLLGDKYLKFFTDHPRYRFKSAISMKDVHVLTECDMEVKACYLLLVRMHGLNFAGGLLDSSQFRRILSVTNKAMSELRRRQRGWLFQ